MPPGLGGALEFDLIFKAVDDVSSVIGGIGGSIAGMLEKVVDAAASWQTALNTVQSNTTLTSAQMAQMNTDIQTMSRQSGASMDDLAQAFMHVTDVGFSMADAAVIVQKAMESAISTGSQTSDVANVLAMQMHEFGIQATQAGNAMNVLHLASASSNVTLDNYVASTSKAVAMAANLGVSFVDANAALSALGRHMDISQANTAFAGELVKMVNDSKGAMDIIKQLSQATGIDLVYDFSSAGLATKGFAAVQNDLAKATDNNSSLMLKLVAATRGGLAALVLGGTGAKDFTGDINTLGAAWSGKLDPTTQAYIRTLDTFNQKLDIVKVDLQQLEIAVGTPMLAIFGDDLSRLMTTITTHQADIQKFATTLGTDIATAVSNLITNIPILVTNIGTAVTNLGAFSDSVGNFFDKAGSNVHNGIESIVDAFAVMSNGIVVAVEGAINVVIGAINGLLAGFGSTDKLGTIAIPSQAQQQQNVADLVRQVVGGSINPATGHDYMGGGAGPSDVGGGNVYKHGTVSFTNTQYGPDGQIVAIGGGPLGPLHPGHTGAGSGGSGGSGGNGGNGGGGGGGGYDPTVAFAAAQSALTTAQQRLQIDQLMNAPQAKLLADIKTILSDFSAPILGNSPTAIQLEGLQLQKQIATATTKTAVTGGPYASFAANQYASEGSTIAAFGSPGRNAQAEMIGHLRQLLASADKQIALLTGMLTSSQRQAASSDLGAKAGVATAQNTGKLAAALSGPHQASDPRSSHGLVAIHR